MKIRITAGSCITGQGTFITGDILSEPRYSKAFLEHLVYDAGAAEFIYETKIEPPLMTKAPAPVQEEKKTVAPILSQSLQPAKVSHKPTRGRPKKTRM